MLPGFSLVAIQKPGSLFCASRVFVGCHPKTRIAVLCFPGFRWLPSKNPDRCFVLPGFLLVAIQKPGSLFCASRVFVGCHPKTRIAVLCFPGFRWLPSKNPDRCFVLPGFSLVAIQKPGSLFCASRVFVGCHPKTRIAVLCFPGFCWLPSKNPDRCFVLPGFSLVAIQKPGSLFCASRVFVGCHPKTRIAVLCFPGFRWLPSKNPDRCFVLPGFSLVAIQKPGSLFCASRVFVGCHPKTRIAVLCFPGFRWLPSKNPDRCFVLPGFSLVAIQKPGSLFCASRVFVGCHPKTRIAVLCFPGFRWLPSKNPDRCFVLPGFSLVAIQKPGSLFCASRVFVGCHPKTRIAVLCFPGFRWLPSKNPDRCFVLPGFSLVAIQKPGSLFCASRVFVGCHPKTRIAVLCFPGFRWLPSKNPDRCFVLPGFSLVAIQKPGSLFCASRVFVGCHPKTRIAVLCFPGFRWLPSKNPDRCFVLPGFSLVAIQKPGSLFCASRVFVGCHPKTRIAVLCFPGFRWLPSKNPDRCFVLPGFSLVAIQKPGSLFCASRVFVGCHPKTRIAVLCFPGFRWLPSKNPGITQFF